MVAGMAMVNQSAMEFPVSDGAHLYEMDGVLTYANVPAAPWMSDRAPLLINIVTPVIAD